MKTLEKTILSLTLAASALVAPAARADHEERELERALISVSTLMITFWPTFLPTYITEASKYDNNYPAKQYVFRAAAVEAAEYLNNGGNGVGPHLKILVKSNPDRSVDEVVEEVLMIAEQL